MKEKGLTLVEMIMAMAIAAVVGGLLLIIIVNSAGLFYSQGSKVEQGLNINDALTIVRTTIKESSKVAAGYPQSSPTYTSGINQLVLKIPSKNNQGDVIAGIFDYFVFYKEASKLRFKSFPDSQSIVKASDQILAGNVNGLRFDYFDSLGQEVTPTSAVKVKITLTLQQKVGAVFETSVATSEANLRND